VQKKRETLRQLVLSLQSRLNPDLQYDVQQGTVPPAAVMPPETSVSDVSLGINAAEDADVLNPVASNTDDADLVQTSTEQTDANKHNLCEESENSAVASVPDRLPDDLPCIINSAPAQVVSTAADAESVIAQSVTTLSVNDDAHSNVPASSDVPICPAQSSDTPEKMETAVSDGISQGPPVSECSSAAVIAAQDMSERFVASSLTVFEHLVNERTGTVLVADAEHMAKSAGVTDASDEPCAASGSSDNLRQISDTVSCAEDSISRCIMPHVNESFVGDTELQNSSCELSAAEITNR